MNDRIVLPELLDALPPEDASARRSRRDLRRVNAWMRHPRRLARILRDHWPAGQPQRIVELGAGDGHFMLNVARRSKRRFPGTEVILVDRLNALDPRVHGRFNQAGWASRLELAEATEWLRRANPGAVPTTIISNLFFHQFETAQLQEMLRLAAGTASLVVALEPRRSEASKLGGWMLWAIGCNRVTRHDANISIRAGFVGGELTALWPDAKNWELTERPVGFFSHLFIARRKG